MLLTLFLGQFASVCLPGYHFGVRVEKKWRSFRVNLEITSALSIRFRGPRTELDRVNMSTGDWGRWIACRHWFQLSYIVMYPLNSEWGLILIACILIICSAFIDNCKINWYNWNVNFPSYFSILFQSPVNSWESSIIFRCGTRFGPSWLRWIESRDKSLYSWMYEKKYVSASFLKQEFFKVELLHPTELKNVFQVYEINVMVYFQPGEWMRTMCVLS